MGDRLAVPGSESTPQPEEPEKPEKLPGWDGLSDGSADPMVNPPFSLPDDVAPAPEGELNSLTDEEAQPLQADSDENLADEPLPEPVVPVVGTRRRAPRQSDPMEEAVPSEGQGRGYGCADVITALFLLMTIAVCAFSILLMANPNSPLNPLPPRPTLVIFVPATDLPTDTPTVTFTPQAATATPLASSTPTATSTSTPTWTPTITDTPVLSGVLPTVTQTIEAVQPIPQYTLSPFPYTVRSIRYTAHVGQEGCSWQSIAGSVTNLTGKPVKGMAFHVTSADGNIDEKHFTGTEPRFGESGFEVFLGATAREDRYTLQLLGPNGAPVSDVVTVQTKSDCKQNVVVVNFIQNHAY